MPMPLLLATALATPAPPSAACPAPAAAVVERFIAADCPDCWAGGGAAAPAEAWTFDWVLPSAAGDAAALSAAAIGEAAARVQRAARAAAPPPVAARAAPRPRGGLRLRAIAGPAWNGYFGVQMDVDGRPPPAATGWLALVELIPAGAEGNAQPRALLRNVAGPFPLAGGGAGGRQTERRAMRWPEGAQPQRLVARAWVEDADGRIVAVAQERCEAAAGR